MYILRFAALHWRLLVALFGAACTLAPAEGRQVPWSNGAELRRDRRQHLEREIIRSHVGAAPNADNSAPSHSASPAADDALLNEALWELAKLSEDPDAATDYVRELTELQDVALETFGDNVLQVDSVLDLGSNVTSEYGTIGGGSDSPASEVAPGFVNELKYHLAVSAAAYCAKHSVFPRWKCGYPRCSADDLQYPINAAAKANALAGMQTISYFHGSLEHMVGFVGINPRLDSLLPQVPSNCSLREFKRRSVAVSFRGSLHWKNFYNDLRADQMEFNYPTAPPGSLVHAGFWETWKDVSVQVREGVRAAIQTVLADNTDAMRHIEIAITGHSLGGAVGVLAGLHLRQLAMTHDFEAFGLRPCTDCTPEETELLARMGLFRFANTIISFKVYTYGQPRMGNDLFADWVMGIVGFPIHRTTYFDDLIPHLPPRNFPFGLPFNYRHPAVEYHIKQGMQSTLSCDCEPRTAMVCQPHKSPLTGLSAVASDKCRNNCERGEDPACSAGVRFLNILSHLTYWNVIYGPWC